MTKSSHKSGFVSIVGKPNAGKSTLINAFVGRKLSIITPRAQTTRHRILGIASGDDYQVVFSDTPGVILPQYQLHRSMMKSVRTSLEDADLVVLLVDVHEKFPEDEMFRMLSNSEAPLILAVNKVDSASPQDIEARKAEVLKHVTPRAIYLISALRGDGVQELFSGILNLLPEGPPYYDKDSLSDRPERFFAAEIIREKIFLHLHEEIPYGCEVTITAFDEEENMDRIYAEIHVERKTLKGMLIGKGGSMLKKIGSEARKDIEEFTGKKAYLELYVRVSEGWKDNQSKLRGFGYE